MSLTIFEATALLKSAEKEVKLLKESGEEVPPGNHLFDFTVHVNGSLSRGSSTKVTPSFSMDRHLKPLLLRYAATLGRDAGEKWISTVMSIDGALGAVIQLGPETVMHGIDFKLQAIWEAAEKAAKEKFQAVTPKTDRAGNTVMVSEMERVVKKRVEKKV